MDSTKGYSCLIYVPKYFTLNIYRPVRHNVLVHPHIARFLVSGYISVLRCPGTCQCGCSHVFCAICEIVLLLDLIFRLTWFAFIPKGSARVKNTHLCLDGGICVSAPARLITHLREIHPISLISIDDTAGYI